MDGALTTQPRTRAVPPVAQRVGVVDAVTASQRRGHQGHNLVSCVRSARGISEVNVTVHQFTQAQVVGQGDRKKQPSIGHQAGSDAI